MRFQLAVAPEVRPGPDGATLVHPETGAAVAVPAAFVDVLPFAARPFTARDLVERSGVPLAPTAVEHALAELRAAGIVLPAPAAADRVARASFHPLAVLARPAVGLPLLVVAAAGVALQLPSIAFFARDAVRTFRGAFVVPVLLAIVIVPAARALFRREVLGGGAVRGRLRGVIPTWEVLSAEPTGRAGRLYAHLSGFLFDLLLMNACVLAMRTKPFELGYAGIETPVAFLAVDASVFFIALNPLAKYDVYYALEDLLGVADLRGQARARLFQLVGARRRDATTLVYAAYFVASIAYGLVISVGLLAVAYGVSSRLFPVDRPLRLGLAAALVGVVAWRAIQTVHRPVLRALAARRRRLLPKSADAAPALALGAPAAVLAPSLHASEGFPFAFSLRESVDDRVHDFAALAPRLEVHVLEAARVDAGAVDLDEPEVRALALRMFAQPARALGAGERTALTVAVGLQKELPLERFEPVPHVAVLDGTFKHGALDVAVRLRSASELDVFRPLFAPLRSRHVAERDVVDVAFRDRAVDRFTHLVLLDDNDAAGRSLRVASLRACVERGAYADAEADAGAAVHDVIDALAGPGGEAALAVAARIRRTSPELLRAAGCAAVLAPVDVEAVPAGVRAWGLRAGLFFAETRAGRTRLACHIRCPTLLVPTGHAERPTGLKLRLLVAEPFDPAARSFAPLARYELLSPHRNFLGGLALDAGELPVWIGAGGEGDTVFCFDGELKAMACRHLLGLRALSAGGFNHPYAAALATHLAKEPSVTFVLDDEAPVYRRARTDQLLDPVVRTLQLAWRTRALAPSAKLSLMRGLKDGDKKLDLDEVAGLPPAAREDAVRRFRAATGDAVDVGALLEHPDVGPWLAELCAFSDRFYAVLLDVKRARVRGSGAEVRDLAAALAELEAARKRLAALAGPARDAVLRALRSRR